LVYRNGGTYQALLSQSNCVHYFVESNPKSLQRISSKRECNLVRHKKANAVFCEQLYGFIKVYRCIGNPIIWREIQALRWDCHSGACVHKATWRHQHQHVNLWGMNLESVRRALWEKYVHCLSAFNPPGASASFMGVIRLRVDKEFCDGRFPCLE
jgi:hypothetical protein